MQRRCALRSGAASENRDPICRPLTIASARTTYGAANSWEQKAQVDKLETMESRLLDRSKGLAVEDHGELLAGERVAWAE